MDVMRFPGTLGAGQSQTKYPMESIINECSTDGSSNYYLSSNPMLALDHENPEFFPPDSSAAFCNAQLLEATTSANEDNAVLLPLESEDASALPASQWKGKKKGKVLKKISCPYEGCKTTFTRNFQLKRHEQDIYLRNSSLLCYVYGCERSTRSFGRLDKFYEHVRKKHEKPY
jgi:hypothetical protein